MINYRKEKKKMKKYANNLNISIVDGISINKIINGIIKEDKRKKK